MHGEDDKTHVELDVALDEHVHDIESCGGGHRAMRERGRRRVQGAAGGAGGGAPPRLVASLTMCHSGFVP